MSFNIDNIKKSIQRKKYWKLHIEISLENSFFELIELIKIKKINRNLPINERISKNIIWTKYLQELLKKTYLEIIELEKKQVYSF